MPDESNQGTASPATPSSPSTSESPSPAPSTPSFNQPAKPGVARTGFGSSPRLENPFLGTPASPGDVPPVPAAPIHGGAAAPSVTGAPAGGQAAADGSVPPQPGSAPAAPAAAPAPALTPETLKTIVESTVRGIEQRQQQSQPVQERPQMTQEQFNAHYGLPMVDDQVYEAILGTGPDKPERAQALQTVLQQSSRAAVLIAQDLIKSEVQQIRNELTPIFAERQAARQKQLEDGFYTAFPEFKGEEALITELRDAHIARKTQFASIDEAYKTVAAQARQIVARFRTAGTAKPAGGETKPEGGSSKPPARTMTPSSQGGRGGTGAATQKSTAEQIFG